MQPVDNDYYVRNAQESPKKTTWEYHGIHNLCMQYEISIIKFVDVNC